MTIRRDTPRVTTFDELFRKYDFEIINDLTTGGTTKALSAEMGKRIANSNYRKTAVYRLGNDCDNNVEEWVFGGGSSNRNNYPEANKWYYVNTIHYTATMRKQIAYESQTGAVWTRDRLNSGVWLSWVPHTISGSNANGTYIKFPDGTMECYGTKLIPSVSFSSVNAVYYALLPTIAFAATFYNVPIVVSSVEMGNVGATQVSGISTTGFTGAIISASSATFDVTIRFIAKGRWKA